MDCVPRNACQFKVCKTSLCILFTQHCLAQLRILRFAESLKCMQRYCWPCEAYHFLLDAIYCTSGKWRGSLLGNKTYIAFLNTQQQLASEYFLKDPPGSVTKYILLSWFYKEIRGSCIFPSVSTWNVLTNRNIFKLFVRWHHATWVYFTAVFSVSIT